MNKKIIALLATGAILTTAVAAGCASQKKTNPVNEVISALESAVVSETEPGIDEMKTSVDTAETTAETANAETIPSTVRYQQKTLASSRMLLRLLQRRTARSRLQRKQRSQNQPSPLRQLIK